MGAAGYDPEEPDMRGILLAKGPGKTKMGAAGYDPEEPDTQGILLAKGPCKTNMGGGAAGYYDLRSQTCGASS